MNNAHLYGCTYINTMNTQTIRVNNVDINKEEAYEYLHDILVRAYKHFGNVNFQYNRRVEKDDAVSQERFLDTCDFIRTVIGEENVDDFLDYISQFC